MLQNGARRTAMKQRRHTPEQVIRKIAEGEKLLNQGHDVAEVCRQLEITESTWHRWRNQYGGMKANDAKRLKELEKENASLKRIVANQALDIDMLKFVGRGKILTPNLRRRVVVALVSEFGVSERRACVVIGQSRSTQRLAPPSWTESEEEIRAFLRDFAKKHPRWGWRRGHDALRDAGWHLNHKRVQRLWREEGLKVPYRKRKKRLTGIGVQVGAMRPIAPNVIWAMDFQFDQTSDLRTIKMLNIIDEFTRECLSIDVARSITADDVVNRLDELMKQRGAPHFLRMDNGPEFVAHALNDWCRFNKAGSLFIDPGSPWQNGWIESFNARLRDEFLNGQQFDSLLEAKVLLEDWRHEYNHERTHSALRRLTPVKFAETWKFRNQQRLAELVA
ncbi:MAG: IS3 family transposase [Actinomycetota bacterium]|nr:IS3 family transposase [Actinomycetota bacterium]